MNNYLNKITLNNSSDLVIKNNRGSSSGRSGQYLIDTCRNISVVNNICSGIILYADTLISITDNDVYCYRCGNIAAILELNENLEKNFKIFEAAA